MTRLFTFGCSFTQYPRWPTWADALGQQYDYFENWGICGAGNSLIFNSLIECNLRKTIKSTDHVFIMWTNTSREDRYVGRRWLAQGNVYWASGNDLPKEYVKKFACERGYLIRDLAYIAATQKVLECIGCRYLFLSMVPFGQSNLQNGLGSNANDITTDVSDVIDLYKDVLCKIKPSIFTTVFSNDWHSRPGIFDSHDPTHRDFHPTPLEHLEYLDIVCPDIEIKASTKQYMYDVEKQIKEKKFYWKNQSRPEIRL